MNPRRKIRTPAHVEVVPLVRRLGEPENRLDHPRRRDSRRHVVHPQDPGAIQHADRGRGDRRRRTVRLVQAGRLADEVLVGDRSQQRKAEVGDLTQPPGQLQTVPGVLVQVVPRIENDLALLDPLVHRRGDLLGQERLDLRHDVVVGRPPQVLARCGSAVGDHHAGPMFGDHGGKITITQPGGVVDHRGSGGQTASGDLGSEGVDGDHHIARLGDRGDHGHHPVDLLGLADFRGVRRERHSSDIDPARTRGISGQRGLDRAVEGKGATVVEERVRCAVDDPHHHDLPGKVEPPPADGPHWVAQRRQVGHGPILPDADARGRGL